MANPAVINVTVSKPADLVIKLPGTQGPAGPQGPSGSADISRTFTWNADGTLATAVDAGGSRTFAYNPDGTLASVTGTGTYKSKTYTYAGGNLSGITVLP